MFHCGQSQHTRYTPLAILPVLFFAGLFSFQADASEARKTPIVRAVQRVRPSVVNIHSEKTLTTTDARFGQIETSRRVNGMGTGVIVDPRGYIITNHHVIDGVQIIRVTSAEGMTFDAKLIASQKDEDLALIKIDAAEELSTLPLGTSCDLMEGETVLAIGNAFGYSHTVTRGIISSLHRTVALNETQQYKDLIQTDASINPGNSGGPLVNIDGDVIGINVAVRAGAQGIGFAIPIDKALDIAAKMITEDAKKQSWHGIKMKSYDPSEKPNGIEVESVYSKSNAGKSGLQSGDIIKSIDGNDVQRSLDLEFAIMGKKAGQEIDLKVERDGEMKSLTLALSSTTLEPKSTNTESWGVLGLKMEPAPTNEFSKLKTRYRGGMSVTNVRPSSPAAKQGIREGDILVGLHIWETVSDENIAHILHRDDFEKLQPLKFYVVRNGKTLYGFLRTDKARR